MRNFLFWFLGLFIVGIIATYLVCGITTDDGYQVGVMMKLSKKGAIFKTYEGEMNKGGMGNIPNTAQMNEVWNFSVRNGETADQLVQMQGRKVKVHYREVLKSFFWQGHTNFFVDSAELLP